MVNFKKIKELSIYFTLFGILLSFIFFAVNSHNSQESSKTLNRILSNQNFSISEKIDNMSIEKTGYGFDQMVDLVNNIDYISKSYDEIGNEYLSKGDITEATKQYDLAIEINPYSAEALFYKAYVLF